MSRSKKTIKTQVVKAMKNAGVYKEESEQLINLYVDMWYHYDIAVELFEAQGCVVEEEFTNRVGATNMRKTPTLSSIEKLRVDIMNCSEKLLLSPKQLVTVKAPAKREPSKLEQVFTELGEKLR